jgi:regulator of sigma E protease
MKNLLWFLAIIGLGVAYLQPGHWAMIAALMVMIVVHEFGHWVVARLCGIDVPTFSVGMGSAPRLVLFKLWGTEFQITPWLLGGYVKIDPSAENFVAKPARQRLAVMVAGVVMNVVLALAVVIGVFACMGEKTVKYDGTVVRDFPAAGVSAARDAGLQAGDKLVAVDGVLVKDTSDLPRLLAPHKNGTAADLTLERGGQQLHKSVTPDKDGRIGIVMGTNAKVEYTRLGPVDAVVRGTQVTYDMSTRLIYGVGVMLHIVPTPEGLPAGATEVHGIVAIVQMGDMALQNGLYSFLMLVAIISINFAVMNILPIPVLDGGHIMFIAFEKLTGKRVPAKVQGLLTLTFIVLLFGLMIFGVVNDIVHPIKF